MLACLALLLGVALADVPAMAAELEAHARELAAAPETRPDLASELDQLSEQAERLSATLDQFGVGQDLPSVFHSIAQDARNQAREIERAPNAEARDAALARARLVVEDTIMLAPMAGSAAADAAAERKVALN